MNISDIAKLAGVSSAAVSRYFNNGYISEEKKKAIKKVVDETGFRPSMQAQTLRTKKTKIIGVILPKIDSYSLGSVVAGILSVLDKTDYEMMLADTQNSPEKELKYLSIFSEKQVDAVIFLGTVFTPEHKRILKQMTVPLVMVGQYLSGCNCVYHDDYHASYELTELMLNKGRRRPGYISAIQQDKATGYDRYRGFCDALEQAGLGEWKSNYVTADFTMESGYEKAEELLKKKKDIDALLCATDSIAIGAMLCLKDHKIKIPDKIIIAGHGGSRITRITSPTLTTAGFSYEESGILAAERILELLEDPETTPKAVMLGYRILKGESTAERGSE